MGLNKSILLQGPLLFSSHYYFLSAMDSFLVPNLLQNQASLVILVLVKPIFFYFLDGQWSIKWILLDYFPGIKMKLGIHGTLSCIKDSETEVIRLNMILVTSSIGRYALMIKKLENSCKSYEMI